MALLAGPKRKKQFGLDPNNINWSNDDSKLGQRMLEKMGWEKGKGLGARLDGIKDNIKAPYKWDTRGLGSTPKEADAWIAHQDDFNELLMQLNNQGSTQESPAEKPEERAPDGHKRYYGRFARGRVPTLRSTEDLNCIFGKRKNASQPETPTSEPVIDSGSDCDEKKHGITTIKSSTSVQEYFSQKMAALKAKRAKCQTTDCPSENKLKETDDENRYPTVFGYGSARFMYKQERETVQSDKVNYSSQECVEEETLANYDFKEKKAKKKDGKNGSSGEIAENANVPNLCLLSEEKSNVEDGDIDTKAISRKKKKKNRVDATDLVEANVKCKSDTRDCVEVVSLKRQVEHTDDAATEGKRKRRKLDGDEVCVREANMETPEMNTKKKSKGAATNVEAVGDEPNTTKKDKKSKKRKTIDHIEEEKNSEITETSTDESNNKTKKKSKHKEIVPSESVETGEISPDSAGEKKKSKKKSRNKDKVQSESVDMGENLPDSAEEKKKSKKKSRKEIVPSESVETGKNLLDSAVEKKKSKKSRNKDLVQSETVDIGETLHDGAVEKEKRTKKSRNKDMVPIPIESVETGENLPDSAGEKKKSTKKSKNKDMVPSETVETAENLSDSAGEKKKKKSQNKDMVPSETVETAENLSDSAGEKKKKKSKNKDIVLSETVEKNKERSLISTGDGCAMINTSQTSLENDIDCQQNLLNKVDRTTNRKDTNNKPDPKNMFHGANLREIAGYAMTVPITVRKYRC